ncbi:MBL fold metallo-hydrolase [Thalassotalea ganghwensis]
MKKLMSTMMAVLSFAVSATSNGNFDDLKVVKTQGDVYMLSGDGGNIGVLSTTQGLLLVDNKFSPLAVQIEAAMKSINDKPLKYVVNTHHHGDHTGSNAHFGHHAPIFAHQNVRNRLSSKDDIQQGSLPVVTYQDGVNIYLDEERIKLIHLPSGHTDGDTVVYFEKANVLHTGDLFFHTLFPFIDLNSGGSVKGYVQNVEKIIAMINDETVIIPGHGPIANKADYQAFAAMIRDSIALVEQQLTQGKSAEQIITQGVTEKYKPMSWAFIDETKWLNTLITGLRD